jgi:hypothetical protein
MEGKAPKGEPSTLANLTKRAGAPPPPRQSSRSENGCLCGYVGGMERGAERHGASAPEGQMGVSG